MKIFIICSKAFYDQIPPIKKTLETQGHEIFLPNSYDHPALEAESWQQGEQAHSEFKQKMFNQSASTIKKMDAVLTLNFDKNGQPNYIGGATFLELYEAFRAHKKIFLYHGIPQGMLFDEISGFAPIIIGGDLTKVK